MRTGLIEYLRTSCLEYKQQTGEKLVSKDTLRDLALDMDYPSEDIDSVLDPLPALVNDKYFPA